MAYRASHILIKYDGSARQASWRDPEGTVITARTREMAASTLNELLTELQQLEGQPRAKRFAELARDLSDCGTAREGGDLGGLQAGEMMEEFEEAVAKLPPWTLSAGVIETESGSHIILRTPTDYKPPAEEAAAAAAPPTAEGAMAEITGPYRASHVLVKHEGSARCASWRDPDGAVIRQRSKADARAVLDKIRADLAGVSPPQLYERFSALARVESDCASAKEAGDLGTLEQGEMMEEFESAVACIREGELSSIVDSESGLHLVLRTPIDYSPPAPAAAADGAAQSGKSQTYRGSHILVKHAGSARCASWRDPVGTEIRGRSQEQAVNQLVKLKAELSELRGSELVDRFDELATGISDSGTEAVGGVADTGVCEEGEMEEVFEAALLALGVNELSEAVLTDSGAHLILRTDIGRAPPKTFPRPAQRNKAAPAPAAKRQSAPSAAPAPIPALAPMRKPTATPKARAASSLGWPGRFETTKLHVLLAKRQNSKPPAPQAAHDPKNWRAHTQLKAPRAGSNALLRKVKDLCGDQTGISAIASSPVYIQDPDGKFPCEVARERGLPVKVCDHLIALNRTAENYHSLIDAIETQDWLLVLEIIKRDAETTTIADPNGLNAMDVALRFGSPTRILDSIASALPSSQAQLDEEIERRTTLSTWSKRSMEEVERFIERVSCGMGRQLTCSDTVRDEHKDIRMEWSQFERDVTKIMDPSAHWWQGLVPTGLEAVADRAGLEAAELVDGTVAEQHQRRVDVREKTLTGDEAFLKTLCERGRLRPVEMKHCIDRAITGVDDEASFWQLENLQSALQIDTGTPFATTEVQGLTPLQWAVKCRAPLQSLDVLLAVLVELEKDGGAKHINMVDIEEKNLLHLAAESGAPLTVMQRITQEFPEAAEKQDCNGRFPIQNSLDCLRKTEEQRAGCLSLRKLPELQQVSAYLESLYPQGLQSYYLLKAVGGPSAYLNGGGAKAHHTPDWNEAQRVVSSCPEAAAFPDFGGKYALTYAVELGAAVECVQALHDACPDAAKEEDKQRRITLHYLSEQTPVDVVKLMLSAFPAGTLHGDKNERVPLMLAVKVGVSSVYKKSFEAIKEIERVFTQEARTAKKKPEDMTDKYDKTILHFITEKTPLRAVQMLVIKYPDALRAQDKWNKFAVQTAMKADASDCKEPNDKRCGKCAIDAMANPETGFPTAKNAVDLWEACDTGEWETVVRIADEDAIAVSIAREKTKEWAHFALQLVLCWNEKTCEIVPGRVVQKLVDTYPEAADVPGRNRMKPIGVAKRKLEVHKKKCIGCQDVIHALTKVDGADVHVGSDTTDLQKLTGIDPYHVEKHISDKDLRGTLLLFCKGEELDALEVLIHDATDRRLALVKDVELPANRGGAEAAPTLDDLEDHRDLLVEQGYGRSWITKERRKDFKNAMLKRLRSKQVEFSQAVMQTENRQFRQFRETGEMSLFSSVSPADSRRTKVPASLVVTKREETAKRTKELTFKEATRAGDIVMTRIDQSNKGSRDEAVGYGPTGSANATGTAWDRLVASGLTEYYASPGY